MDVFLTLVIRLLPLYLLIGLGYLAKRYLSVDKDHIAKLLIYILSPAILFHGAYTSPLTAGSLTLPIVFFVVCCAMCVAAYVISSLLWNDSRRNIAAFTSGTGNTGYFGLPVALALFGESSISLMVLAMMGFLAYETSLGLFIAARGARSVKKSLATVFSIPGPYAFALGILLNVTSMQLGATYESFILNARGAFTVLGMMMIGLAMADIKKGTFDIRFLATVFSFKFFLWPLTILSLLWLDTHILSLWSKEIHDVMILLSIVPLAANTVVWATEFKSYPSSAALAVFSSTAFALVYIPAMVYIFIA